MSPQLARIREPGKWATTTYLYTHTSSPAHLVQGHVNAAGERHVLPRTDDHVLGDERFGAHHPLADVPHGALAHLHAKAVRARHQIAFLPAVRNIRACPERCEFIMTRARFRVDTHTHAYTLELIWRARARAHSTCIGTHTLAHMSAYAPFCA